MRLNAESSAGLALLALVVCCGLPVLLAGGVGLVALVWGGAVGIGIAALIGIGLVVVRRLVGRTQLRWKGSL